MTVVLVSVTIGALGLAAAFALVAWRVTREERERSAARVAALAAAIDGSAAELPVHAWPPDEATTEAVDAPVATGGLFAATAQRAEPSRPFAAALVAVPLLGVVLVVALALSAGRSPAASAAPPTPKPLELLSLRHELRDGSLTVTGLVRNPPAGVELDRVTAVVFAFDGQGAFVASGRAPLDFTALDAGEESPFTVSITGHPGVARYRVSFRKDEGGIVPHVDRRESRSSS